MAEYRSRGDAIDGGQDSAQPGRVTGRRQHRPLEDQQGACADLGVEPFGRENTTRWPSLAVVGATV
jgi:hypothetical protein